MKEYECIKCNYKTVRKNNFDKHLKTDNHFKIINNFNTYNGNTNDTPYNIMLSATNDLKNEQPMEQTYNCEKCKYTCYRKSNYNRHLLTTRHISLQSCNTIYECSMCHFKCSKKSNYKIHLTSNKHNQNVKIHEVKIHEAEMEEDEIHEVEKQEQQHEEEKETYKFALQNIVSQDNINGIKNELFVSIMSEIKVMMGEQNKMIQDIATNNNSSTNITNNNISNNNVNKNQQFNMNLFLNETCKDAMNLSEFIENMQVTMEDMEKTGELGFAKGMSRIIMNNLNAIDVCKRPIHCSDVKRETLYVKNNGVWEKETDERNKTKEIIYKVSRLNLKHLLNWRDLPRNKGYEKSDHAKNDEFTNLVIEINKMREEEFDKIITSISKHVAIDKEKVKMSGYLN